MTAYKFHRDALGFVVCFCSDIGCNETKVDFSHFECLIGL